MPLFRNDPLKFVLGGLAIATLGCFAAAPPYVSQAPLKDLGNGIYAIEAPLDGANGPNLAFLVTSEGVVLVDDRLDENYVEVIARVRSVTDQPIRYVIKTHHHGTHDGAHKELLPDIEVLSHANARAHLETSEAKDLPSITYTDEFSIFLGGKEVRLLHPGPAHTDGDTVIYFPFAKLAYVGDLMAATDTVTNPSMDYENGGSLKQWPDTINRVLELDVETIIPGTGFGVTNPEELAAHRDKIEQIESRMRELVAEGKTSAEIEAALIKEFSFKPVNLRGLSGLIQELGG